MQARNLAAVVDGYREAGATCVVVSGVVDVRRGVPLEELPGIAVTVCRLRAADEELSRRLTGRQGSADGLAHVLREAAGLDAIGGPCVDTTGLTVAQAAQQVLERAEGWTTPRDASRSPVAARPEEEPDGRPVLWVCGPTGVGKSTVAFRVYLALLAAGRPAAYADLDQLGFLPGPADHRLKARNLAAVWRTYRRAGAETLVMAGPVGDRATAARYEAELSGSALTVCRLHAGRRDLTERIMLRGRGLGSWPQPGDPLIGRPVSHLRRIAGEAVLEAQALERAGPGFRVDTGGRSVDEVVALVLQGLRRTGRVPFLR
ncbi:hypothetical protein [Nucisporomicrobium flavum]|uniref:hypothetical protein n=1 Tax=Nucisporomicrobium flavum TaxID=2785915 RepID=UPI0018F4909E|nr:hypothetical protein [Nucisporomicrobium flavum]